MKYRTMQWPGLALAVLAGALLAAPLFAQNDANSLDELLEQVRTGTLGDQADLQKRQSEFDNSPGEKQAELLKQAKAEMQGLQEQSAKLESAALDNAQTFEKKIAALQQSLGPNAKMFGILQQSAGDLIGIFRNSPTSIEYPERVEWLNDFIGRIEKSSEIFTLDEVKHLWFLIQQETTASGKIAKVQTSVLGPGGGRKNINVVRVGKFNLVTDNPEPLYLSWQPDNQSVSVLKRQPAGRYLDEIGDYTDSTQGVHALGIDPTGGSLLTRLVDAPSLRERVGQGGLIGYLILCLGAFGVLVAIYKLVEILIISNQVERQRRNLDNPQSNNPLGRMLRVYDDNRGADTETLEMRLGEAILEERPRIDRFVGLLKVIAVIAPLMGLLGTVVGMIATFQAITLFGTGDPKTMAGGISQALVTTVLGLTVAIPTVLLHAMVAARAKSVINTLKHQTAGLIAERMEEHDRGGGYDTRSQLQPA